MVERSRIAVIKVLCTRKNCQIRGIPGEVNRWRPMEVAYISLCLKLRELSSQVYFLNRNSPECHVNIHFSIVKTYRSKAGIGR